MIYIPQTRRNFSAYRRCLIDICHLNGWMDCSIAHVYDVMRLVKSAAGQERTELLDL